MKWGLLTASLWGAGPPVPLQLLLGVCAEPAVEELAGGVTGRSVRQRVPARSQSDSGSGCRPCPGWPLGARLGAPPLCLLAEQTERALFSAAKRFCDLQGLNQPLRLQVGKTLREVSGSSIHPEAPTASGSVHQPRWAVRPSSVSSGWPQLTFPRILYGRGGAVFKKEKNKKKNRNKICVSF